MPNVVCVFLTSANIRNISFHVCFCIFNTINRVCTIKKSCNNNNKYWIKLQTTLPILNLWLVSTLLYVYVLCVFLLYFFLQHYYMYYLLLKSNSCVIYGLFLLFTYSMWKLNWIVCYAHHTFYNYKIESYKFNTSICIVNCDIISNYYWLKEWTHTKQEKTNDIFCLYRSRRANEFNL